MLDQHPDGELAPRDIVARAVHEAKISGRGAFLDCRAAVGKHFPERFPTVYAACKAAGIDPVTEPIPIAPAAHYHMGGVHVDSAGRTSLDGLWACGEVACTGAHGANRLASNSLLEAVVFAARVAEDIHGLLPNHKMTRWVGSAEGEAPIAPEADGEAIGILRATMTRHVGVVRDAAGLTAALARIEHLSARPHGPEVRNALTAAKLVAAAALARRESRGGHYRSDYPAPDAQRAVRMFMTLDQADAAAEAAASPLELAS
jgi:L-aspartate oxidase